ncbi:MAG: hypothetical protein NZ693_00760 [Thermoflexales bacterium]|nr:hypothetical protein [Thermoflexales bacterium]
MDHARTFGVTEGLERPDQVIEDVISAGADGIMTTFGVLKRYRTLIADRVPVILRLDGGSSQYREDWLAYTEWDLLHSVEDAVRLGASGVVVMAFIGGAVELQTLRIVARVASACMDAGLPLMVEALPCPSERIPDAKDARAMASAARIAFEHGADLVKTYYTGSVAGFRQVVENCPVPVLIAGGARMSTLEEALNVVAASMDAGAAGVVFGRNIWQSGNTAGVVRALRQIIHGGDSVAQALQIAQPVPALH